MVKNDQKRGQNGPTSLLNVNVVDMSLCPHGYVMADCQHFVLHPRRCYKKVEMKVCSVNVSTEVKSSLGCLESFKMPSSLDYHKVTI